MRSMVLFTSQPRPFREVTILPEIPLQQGRGSQPLKKNKKPFACSRKETWGSGLWISPLPLPIINLPGASRFFKYKWTGKEVCSYWHLGGIWIEKMLPSGGGSAINLANSYVPHLGIARNQGRSSEGRAHLSFPGIWDIKHRQHSWGEQRGPCSHRQALSLPGWFRGALRMSS